MTLTPSIVGRTVPNPYGAGTWTVEALAIEPSFVTGEPTITATILWEGTGSPVLDGDRTLGTLAPGLPLWDALTREDALARDLQAIGSALAKSGI